MIRCIRKLFTLAVVLVLLAAFGYSVVLPRVLPLQYRDIVEQYAAEYGLEEAFVYGVIFCESHFEPDVISSADAIGLMQVTEETGKWAAAQMGLDPAAIDLTDPDTNIHIGCWYLSWLMRNSAVFRKLFWQAITQGMAAWRGGLRMRK